MFLITLFLFVVSTDRSIPMGTIFNIDAAMTNPEIVKYVVDDIPFSVYWILHTSEKHNVSFHGNLASNKIDVIPTQDWCILHDSPFEESLEFLLLRSRETQERCEMWLATLSFDERMYWFTLYEERAISMINSKAAARAWNTVTDINSWSTAWAMAPSLNELSIFFTYSNRKS